MALSEMEQLVVSEVRAIHAGSAELREMARQQLLRKLSKICGVMDVDPEWLVDVILTDFIVVPKDI